MLDLYDELNKSGLKKFSLVVSSQIRSQPQDLLRGKTSELITHDPHLKDITGPHTSSIIQNSPPNERHGYPQKPCNHMLDMYSHSKIGPFCVSYQLSCLFTETLYFWELLFPPTRSMQFRFHCDDKKRIYFYPGGLVVRWEYRIQEENIW